MNAKDKFWFSCIWFYPLSFAFIWSIMFCLASFRRVFGQPFNYNLVAMLLIALIPTLIGVMFNSVRYLLGKRNFDPFGKDTPTSRSKEKLEAMNQEVPDKYLTKKVEGFIVGKYKNKYVKLNDNENDIKHILCIGGSGSGKSTMFIAWLNENFRKPADERKTVFAIDCKPELAKSSVKLDDPYVKTVDPSSCNGAGFDVWYGLSQDSTDDEIIERNDLIARSIIVNPGGDNAFFYQNAQNILVPALCYGFRKGNNFSESMLRVIHNPVSSLIAQILSDNEMVKSHPKIAGMLRVFEGAEGDAFESIQMTLQTDLRIFMNDNVIYQLGTNEVMATPKDLAEGISIFITISDSLLEQYKAVIRLIIACTINYVNSSGRQKEASMIYFLIDEYSSLSGQIPGLLGLLERGRSRKLLCMLACQSYQQLVKSIGPTEAKIVLDNCETILILSVKDRETAEMISSWFGSYREKMTSHRNGLFGFADRSSENISEQFRQVLEVSDIQRLRSEKKIIVFTDGDRFIISKCPYYQIPELLKRSNEIVAYNDEHEKESEEEWFYIG